jgi:uncharacterized membrane protein
MEAAMKTNIGSLDPTIRFFLASGLFYLGLFTFSNSPLGIVLVVAGTVSFVTASLGFCGLYRLLGISTYETPERL